MDVYNLSPRIRVARDLICKNDERSLLYAALELRFCLELIAYRHLALYGDKLPSNLAKEWKADQIIRLLAELDEGSDQPVKLAVSATPLDPNFDFTERNAQAIKELEFKSLGGAERIGWKRFRTMYHRLGSYLHLDRSTENLCPNTDKLKEVLSAVELVASSNFIMAKTNPLTYNCSCGRLLVIGPAELSSGVLFCTNVKCNLVYRCDKEEKGVRLTLADRLVLNCECQAQITLAFDRIVHPISCPSCQSKIQVSIGSVMITLEKAEASSIHDSSGSA